jgi:putative NADPH-quinone reductase
MRVFVVHAHPEPQSFNGAMTAVAVQALTAAGHEAKVSDLYAIRFNPVSDRSNFTTVADAAYYRQQTEEAHAAKNDGFAADIAAEALLVRRAYLPVSTVVVRSSGDPKGVGRPGVRIGWKDIWRR